MWTFKNFEVRLHTVLRLPFASKLRDGLEKKIVVGVVIYVQM
jgi:hypothetical protein